MPLKCKKCNGPHLTIKCGKNNLNKKFNNNINKFNTDFNKNKKFNQGRKKFCVKISNIPSDLTIDELSKLMVEWGEIGKINFNNNIQYKSAFIDFYIKDEAEYFIQALDKTPFGNHIINVDLLIK